MFEDFSFSSPSSARPPRLAFDGDDRLMIDCDNALVSPMSSRCPSPRSTSCHKFPRTLPRSRSSYFRSPQPPTSVPFSTYEDKRLSIGTLTRKLHEHTIQNTSHEEGHYDLPATPSTPPSGSTGSARFQGSILTPPDTDHDDEGYFDSSSITTPSPSLSPRRQSLFVNAASSPFDFLSQGGAIDGLDASNIRAQRQHISRLQCNPSDIEAIRRSVLSQEDTSQFDPSGEDDCHPSSLPPQLSPRRRAATLNRSRFRPGPGHTDVSVPQTRTRRKSSPPHRIEKSHGSSSGRDHRKKSDQGLRRKSLVSAALASMVENGTTVTQL